MAEATCRRQLDLEIPADEVSKAMERVAKEFARVARVPGFRPGKAPVSLIRHRFAEDIKGEVLQSLVPEHLEKAVSEQKLTPVSRPQVDQLDFAEGQRHLLASRSTCNLRRIIGHADVGELEPRANDR